MLALHPEAGGHCVSFRSTRLRLTANVTIRIKTTTIGLCGVDIRVQHMGQNIFCVLEPLNHLEVGGLHCAAQRISLSLASLVDIGHKFGLRAEHDFGVVLEIDLHDFVREAEHDSMTCPHPLLDVHDILDLALRELIGVDLCRFVGLGLFAALKVASEVLKKGNFLLQLLRVLSKCVLFPDVLAIGTPSLVVVEVITVRVQYYLCGVIKVYPCGLI